MNECMIVFEGETWLYYKTDKKDCASAWYEFLKRCEENGINIDNMKARKMVLRDKDQNDIDEVPLR